MAWSIAETINTVEISEECAKELFKDQERSETGEIWYELEEVTNEGKLTFNSDHMEHMDFLQDNTFTDILRKHKVNGDICFGSLEGDNSGSFWGYRFNGEGGMVELVGRVIYEERRMPFAGMTFVVTGKLFGMTREEAHAKIEELGGEVSDSISGKTTHLVVGEKPGSKLAKAQKLGIKIFNEKEFVAMLS